MENHNKKETLKILISNNMDDNIRFCGGLVWLFFPHPAEMIYFEILLLELYFICTSRTFISMNCFPRRSLSQEQLPLT